MRKQPRQGKWLAQRLRSQAATPDSNYLQNTTFLNSVTLWGWTEASLEDESKDGKAGWHAARRATSTRCPHCGQVSPNRNPELGPTHSSWPRQERVILARILGLKPEPSAPGVARPRAPGWTMGHRPHSDLVFAAEPIP